MFVAFIYPDANTRRGWDNSQASVQMLDLRSRVYTAAFESPRPSRVCIKLHKHGKTVSTS